MKSPEFEKSSGDFFFYEKIFENVWNYKLKYYIIITIQIIFIY